MVINQIICARTQTDDSAEPTAKRGLPSLSWIVHLSSVAPKSTLFRTLQPVGVRVESAEFACALFLGIVEPFAVAAERFYSFEGGWSRE